MAEFSDQPSRASESAPYRARDTTLNLVLNLDLSQRYSSDLASDNQL